MPAKRKDTQELVETPPEAELPGVGVPSNTAALATQPPPPLPLSPSPSPPPLPPSPASSAGDAADSAVDSDTPTINVRFVTPGGRGDVGSVKVAASANLLALKHAIAQELGVRHTPDAPSKKAAAATAAALAAMKVAVEVTLHPADSAAESATAATAVVEVPCTCSLEGLREASVMCSPTNNPI